MRNRSHIGALVVLGALGAWACHDSTSTQAGPLVLSVSSRSVSLREDSLRVTTDSAVVTVSAVTSSWTASHGGGSWLTVTTGSGTGNGVVRWRRDTTALVAGVTFVDTVRVTLQGAPTVTVSLVDSVTVRDAPAQYIAVRRAWRLGERDSLSAYVVRTRAMGDFSDLAAQAMLQEDSAVDVVLNPLWISPPDTSSPGLSLAPQFIWGWGIRGIDLMLVFDSVPGGTVQRDSLSWVIVRWWNPDDSTHQGWLVNATTSATFPTYVTVSTTGFDAAGGKSGVGGGEAQLSTGTYWEANAGGYRLIYNSGYGSYAQLTSGPYMGGDYAVGQFGGRINGVVMPRLLGAAKPKSASMTFDFETTRIASWRIFCYYTPVPPVSPYHQCTGAAAARLVAAAREHRLTPAMLAGLTGPFLREVAATVRADSRRARQ